MVSLRANLQIAQFRLTGAKQTWSDPVKLARSIERSQRPENNEPPSWAYHQYRIERFTVDGFPSYSIRGNATQGRHHIMYLHGGAYVHQIEKDHWSFFARLIDAIDCTITVPLYPLAPKHNYRETLSMVESSYQRAFRDIAPEDRVLMGDSCGGGMSLVLAQRRKAEGEPVPGNLVLISPWLDITMKDPMVAGLERRDPYLSAPGLIEAGRMYAGDLDRDDPTVSPINGELSGLGRISVLVGTRDVLLADSRRLRALTAKQHIDIDYLEFEGMYHTWAMEPSPEGRQATREIADILQRGDVH